MTTPNKYQREIAPGVFVDVYDVLVAFDVTCPAIAHAIKKLLCPGQRGHQSVSDDLAEARQSVDRAIELARRNVSGPVITEVPTKEFWISDLEHLTNVRKELCLDDIIRGTIVPSPPDPELIPTPETPTHD